jgi:adenylate cyclase
MLVSGTQFMLQVNDKFGPGVLWRLATGRYYQPREEERIIGRFVAGGPDPQEGI